MFTPDPNSWIERIFIGMPFTDYYVGIFGLPQYFYVAFWIILFCVIRLVTARMDMGSPPPKPPVKEIRKRVQGEYDIERRSHRETIKHLDYLSAEYDKKRDSR